jgi:hypothetical protein
MPRLELDSRHSQTVPRRLMMGSETPPKTPASEAQRLAAAAGLLATLARPGALKLLGGLGRNGSADGPGVAKILKGVAPQSKPLERLLAAGLVCTSPDGIFYALTADGRRAWMAVRGLVD